MKRKRKFHMVKTIFWSDNVDLHVYDWSMCLNTFFLGGADAQVDSQLVVANRRHEPYI